MIDTLSAFEAIQLVSSNRADAFYGAQLAILGRCSAGLMRTSCTRMIEDDPYGGSRRVHDNISVPDWVWPLMLSATGRHLNWKTGDFHKCYSLRRRVEIYGLRFDKADVTALVGWQVAETEAHMEPECRPAHRPAKRRAALSLYLDRLRTGLVCQRRPDEARAIVKAWKGENPPVPGTVSETYLRPFHALGSWEDGKLSNAPIIIAAVEKHLAGENPDKASFGAR